MKKLKPEDLLLGSAAAFIAIPLFLLVLAAGIDLSGWAFTGHEVFPWIGRALSR